MNNTTKGGIIGGGSGAAAGAIIGGLFGKGKGAVELTAELLNTLIEKITVHEAVKGEDGSREQEVEIYYRFIGKID